MRFVVFDVFHFFVGAFSGRPNRARHSPRHARFPSCGIPLSSRFFFLFFLFGPEFRSNVKTCLELEEKLQILEALGFKFDFVVCGVVVFGPTRQNGFCDFFLGFSDRQHMCLLLSRFDGDLQRVADALLFV